MAIVTYVDEHLAFGGSRPAGGIIPDFTSSISGVPNRTFGDVTVTLDYLGDFETPSDAFSINIEGFDTGLIRSAFEYVAGSTSFTISQATWAAIIADGVINISYNLGDDTQEGTSVHKVEEYLRLTFTWDAFTLPSYNSVNGKAGNDELLGTGGRDKIFGFDGNDTIIGGDGHDEIQGGPGDDRIFAGADDQGNDIIFGQDGNELIFGGGGDDHLFGGTGADTMYGGKGDDYLWGDVGNDALYGGQSNDTLLGNAGRDKIDGGAGADTIYGGAGADTIIGGAGDDLLCGGEQLNGADRARDVIVDFEQGRDVIDLSALDIDFSDLTINGNVVTVSGIDASDLTITVTGVTLTESDFVF